jgi:hypothetical protein
MSVMDVLAPVFVQVTLCFGLLFGLIGTRQRAGTPKPGAEAVHALWLDRGRRVGASYANQFEMPLLFFGLVPLALLTHKADAVFVTLEWLYVVARLAQAAVHVTINIVPLRGAFFFASAVVLGIAWIKLFLDLAVGG